MSEIFVDTIKNKAGSTSLDSDKLPDMYTGSVKVWCSMSGNTTVDNSLNVSSITDTGGTAPNTSEVNFTNAMADQDYVGLGTATDSAARFMGIVNSSTTKYKWHCHHSTPSSTTGVTANTGCVGELA